MSVDVAVFVVHGQSSSLSDCIDPYIHNMVTNGHRPEILVLDSTEDPAERNASKESLLKVHRTHRMSVSFASGREHKRYLSNIDLVPLKFAMNGGVGALVNMGLLATRGKSALFIDADTRFQMSSPRLIEEGQKLPPIVRKLNLVGEMSTGEVGRTGIWGASYSLSSGCFYKSRTCVLPPFIPDSGWSQGVPWFLMSKYLPSCTPVDLQLAVRKLSAESGLAPAYTPLSDLIHSLVDPGTLSSAAASLMSHLAEFGADFSAQLIRYVELLSSWDVCVDSVDSLCSQGVKIGYKP